MAQQMLTPSEVAERLDSIIDEIEADPSKVFHIQGDNGQRYVLISVAHHERLQQSLTVAPSEVSCGSPED